MKHRMDQVPWWIPTAFFVSTAAISVTPLLVLKALDRRACRFANVTHQEDS